MGGRGGTSGLISKRREVQQKIDALRQKASDLMMADYSGRRNWDRQLESRVKQGAKINREIEKLERQSKTLDSPKKKTVDKKQSKSESAGTGWRRAGEGWYIGEKGHEIRQNYKNGGYDVVKVSGAKEVAVRHYKTLKAARKHKVK